MVISCVEWARLHLKIYHKMYPNILLINMSVGCSQGHFWKQETRKCRSGTWTPGPHLLPLNESHLQ